MKYDFYKDGPNGFIPDVKLVKIEGDDRTRAVWFLWRGAEQWLEMSKDNYYGDNSWLVTETSYTKDFEEFLDEELEGYDSLESMFELSDIIPMQYEINFE
jgi:hypothetical protein